VTIEEASVLAKKKFAGEFNEALFLQQLSYFQDIEYAPVAFIGESYSENEIKSFLEKQVAEYVKNVVLH